MTPSSAAPIVEPDAIERSGPRRWWAGPLDVEGLALGAVAALGAVVARLGPAEVATTSAHVAAAFDSFGHLRRDGRPLTAFAPESRFFAARDGWVRTHANYPHHAAALRAAVGAGSAAEVGRALAARPARVAERDVLARGGVAAAVRSRESWLAEVGPVTAAPWFSTVAGAGTVRWSPRGERGRPLAGLRVLDVTRVLAGPVAARTLGALGADVLRLDPPGRPELLDIHLDTGFGKRVATADLTDPGVRARVHELLGSADVLLTGYRPGSLTRFGLDAEELAEEHPHLVVGTLDAWGPTPSWAGRRGFDSIVQAATGIADRYGHPDGSPGALPVQALDHATGYGLAAACLGLLLAGGGHARTSLTATGEELWRRAVPADEVEPVGVPELRRVHGEDGELIHVPVPLLLDGAAPAYTGPPRRARAEELRWR
ncbi:CoA transferase [Kineococcus gynurae]|uniref:CoA transferase n=1 Tax=Kineococcus gynurae TaxID=452979 RepID=A0ABV5LMU4_9ACTN